MSPSGRWADFWTRLASAAILAPLALLALWRGGFAWDALVAVALAGLGWEWARLALRAPFWLAGGLLLAWAALLLAGWAAALLALAAAMLLSAKYFGNFAAAGLPYAGLGGLALLWLRQQPNGLIDTLFLVAVVWGTDIGAYLVGRVMGGAKLARKNLERRGGWVVHRRRLRRAAGLAMAGAAGGVCLERMRAGRRSAGECHQTQPRGEGFRQHDSRPRRSVRPTGRVFARRTLGRGIGFLS
jgi:hypothetical protein